MNLGLVAFIIIAGIAIILFFIVYTSHVMELRDRPGCFILGVLSIIALLIFLIWLFTGNGGSAPPSL
jgi:hypothetical protein